MKLKQITCQIIVFALVVTVNSILYAQNVGRTSQSRQGQVRKGQPRKVEQRQTQQRQPAERKGQARKAYNFGTQARKVNYRRRNSKVHNHYVQTRRYNQRPSWAERKVTTYFQKRFDKNKDGYLDRYEIQNMVNYIHRKERRQGRPQL